MNHLTRVAVSCLIALVLIAPASPARAQWADFLNFVPNFGTWLTEIFTGISEESTAVTSALTEGSTGSLFTKEYILDQIAFILAKEALQSLTDSVVDWAGSGFEGSPAFVTNIRSYMLSLGDQVSDDFTSQLSTNGSIDSPFRDSIVSALRSEYYRGTGSDAYFNTNQYTLDQYSDNPEAFLGGDFNQGGIQAWMQAVLNDQNNPLGAYTSAQSELSRRILLAQGERSDELNRGDGFLSFCEEQAVPGESPSDAGEGEGDTTLDSSSSVASPNCQTKTLGSTINDALSKVLGSSVDQYTQADELNEVIGVLIGSLIDRALQEGITEISGDEGSRNRPVEGAPDILNTLLRMTRETQQKITKFQADWQKVGNMANQAALRCPLATLPKEAQDKAGAGLVKAADTLPVLNDFIQRFESLLSGPVQSDELQALTRDYNSFVSSGRLPSPGEVNEAARSATDTPPPDPRASLGDVQLGSLYDQLQNMFETGQCPVENTTGTT